MAKHKGKPQGMNYADVLARKRAVEAGIKQAATDAALQVEAVCRISGIWPVTQPF